MTVTEVRIKLMAGSDRLCAFAAITLDNEFVVRDLKVINGTNGRFIAMPSRRLTYKCPDCAAKCAFQDNFCMRCGYRLDSAWAIRSLMEERPKLHADIAHPISSECRTKLQTVVIAAYDEEVIRSKEPGYVCRYDDYGEPI